MIILHHKYGQLANRMILIIHFVAYCMDRKIPLHIINFNEYIELFDRKSLNRLNKQSIQFYKRNLIIRIIISVLYRFKNISKKSSIINIRNTHDALEKTYDMHQLDRYINKYKCIIPEGWLFRITELTEKHRDFIKTLFQPNRTSKERIKIFLKKIPEGQIKVGIHIRRKDYRDFQGGKYFFNDASYLAFMNQFEILLKNKNFQFIIFSDEPVSDLICNRSQVLVSEHNFIEDFFLISKCDFVLGPPSTFTLVAAYLGGCKLNHIENPLQPLSLHNFQTISCL